MVRGQSSWRSSSGIHSDNWANSAGRGFIYRASFKARVHAYFEDGRAVANSAARANPKSIPCFERYRYLLAFLRDAEMRAHIERLLKEASERLAELGRD